jgi:hypothetical protein
VGDVIVVALHCACLALVFAWFLKTTLEKHGVRRVEYLQMVRLTVSSTAPVFLVDSALAVAGVWQMLSDWSSRAQLGAIAANTGSFALSASGYLLMFFTMRSGFKRRHAALAKALSVSFERAFGITALKALLPAILLPLAITAPIAYLFSSA